ncbi:MAG: glycosyltransferase family 1 protein [bacterium]|nr:glycosyltransferase family 1 protein [bacterium]
MNIGIDIRILAKGTRTGVENYTVNLLSGLLGKDKSITYKLFCNGFKKPKLDYYWLKLNNVKIKTLRIPNRILDLFLRFFKFPKIDRIVGGVDIFLSPHFLLLPVSRGTKIIVVFHDLSFVRFPEFFSFLKLLWHKFIYPKNQAKKANLIIAVSDSTKNDLVNLYGIPREKIKVIYPAVGKEFRPIEKTDSKFLKVKEKYNLPNSFILYFGTIEPRKNILGLVEAFEKIKKQETKVPLEVQWDGFEGVVRGEKKNFFDFKELKLVIAGNRGWLYKDVFEKIEKSPYGEDIIITGFIEEEDKPYLYNLAEIFVYPSFFEGFGFPPLEAMACGIPTAVSNKSSLPEVVGDSAVMFDPQNIDEIGFAIKNILQDGELKESLIEKGLRRAKLFDWDKTADGFLDVFKKI